MFGWIGRIVGALLGYMIAGPIGALLGLIIGNVFDKGIAIQHQATAEHQKQQTHRQSQAQKEFFEITFMVMGHVAKADGIVSEREIHLAQQVMKRMQLTPEQKKQAIHFFTMGKQPHFDLHSALARLMLFCGNQPLLLRMFLDIQYQAASADGMIGLRKQQILQMICQSLGFPSIFSHYNYHTHHQNQQHQRQQHYHRSHSTAGSSFSPLKQAYALLEVKETASHAEIKRAYRKQMSQHHPDKLIAQGLPEQMVKLATEKTQKIQAAYEQIKRAKGF